MGDLAQAVGMILEDSEGVAVKSTQPSVTYCGRVERRLAEDPV